MFKELKDDLEIIFCINAGDIAKNKTRAEYQKVEKIRNYIEYNTEIEAETIDADSITEYA